MLRRLRRRTRPARRGGPSDCGDDVTKLLFSPGNNRFPCIRDIYINYQYDGRRIMGCAVSTVLYLLLLLIFVFVETGDAGKRSVTRNDLIDFATSNGVAKISCVRCSHVVSRSSRAPECRRGGVAGEKKMKKTRDAPRKYGFSPFQYVYYCIYIRANRM